MSPSVKYIALLIGVFLLGALITVVLIIPDNLATLAGAQTPADSTETATPTTAQTPSEQVRQLAQNSNAFANLAGNIDVKYSLGNAEITEKLYKITDIVQGRDQVKHDCFTVQRAIWNAHIPDLNAVKVIFTAPVTDKFGKISLNDQVGSCTLNNTTAKKIIWQNVSYLRAWDGTGSPTGGNTPSSTSTALSDTSTALSVTSYIYDTHSFIGALTLA